MAKSKSVTTGREIPKAFEGLVGLKVGFHPVPCKQAKIVVTGGPGTGKSTFANSFPGMFILDPEEGGNTVADPQAFRFTAPSGTDLKDIPQVYNETVDKVIAASPGGKGPVQMIGLDSYDKLIDLYLQAFCKKYNLAHALQDGAGVGNIYTEVKNDIFRMLDRISRAGLGWMVIAHAVKKSISSGGDEREVTSLAVSNSFKAPLFRECEHMMFVKHGTEQVTIPGEVKILERKRVKLKDKVESRKVRVLTTKPGGVFQGSDSEEVKVRVPLPDRIILPAKGGYGVFEEAYNEAISNLTEEK